MFTKRTDLAIEAHELWQESAGKTTRLAGVKATEKKIQGYPVTQVDILDREGEAALGKPAGSYRTLDLTAFWQRGDGFFDRAVQAAGQQLRELLPEDRYAPLCAASSVAEARRVLLERPFDIVIISAPLPDEFGTKLALHIIDKSSAGVLLLVKAEHYPDLSARLSPQGILLLQKPTSPPLLLQSLQLLCGTRERLRRMEQKTATIEEKMAEIRLVNRAKWQLIDQRGMTEQDAHRYIEKQAMDRCVTRRAVAEDILSGAL